MQSLQSSAAFHPGYVDWIIPQIPAHRRGKRVAIIGSGRWAIGAKAFRGDNGWVAGVQTLRL